VSPFYSPRTLPPRSGVSMTVVPTLIDSPHRDCVAIVRKGPRQARGGPEAGMNEEASAGKEDVQIRPTIFRKEGRIVKLSKMIKLLNPPVPMEKPLPHDSE